MTDVLPSDPAFLGRLALIAFSGFVGCLIGCGSGSPGDVSGKVTYNGKPLSTGIVVFLGRDSKTHDSPIAADGTYSITGVAAGPAKIAVRTPGKAGVVVARTKIAKNENPRIKELPPADPGKWVDLPSAYKEFDTSGLAHTVISGPNTFDIVLIGETKK